MEDADQTLDADTGNKVEQPDKHTDADNAADYDGGILQHLLGGGPNDLLQLAAELAEVSGDLAPGSLEPVFLLSFCHDD